MKFYKDNIIPADNTIFVFGSNPRGINGNPNKGTGGAALQAVLHFGVGRFEVMNNRISDSGKAYGLVTVKGPGMRKSLSKQQIIDNIRILYSTAESLPGMNFMIAYRNTYKTSLNGYTGFEMMKMFIDAGNIPDNIFFSSEWEKYMKDSYLKSTPLFDKL